jgi:hypothetical protein
MEGEGVTREKIIKDMKEYQERAGSLRDWARWELLYYARELLTPKVLAIDEIPEHDGAVFIEYHNGDIQGEWMLFLAEHNPYLTFTNERGNRVYLETGAYNDRWRAWTGRPTPEQRWQK